MQYFLNYEEQKAVSIMNTGSKTLSLDTELICFMWLFTFSIT